MADQKSVEIVPASVDQKRDLIDIYFPEKTKKDDYYKKLTEKQQEYTEKYEPFCYTCAKLDFDDEVRRVTSELSRTSFSKMVLSAINWIPTSVSGSISRPTMKGRIREPSVFRVIRSRTWRCPTPTATVSTSRPVATPSMATTSTTGRASAMVRPDPEPATGFISSTIRAITPSATTASTCINMES